mmetsp:Transcript_8193/g.26061  ORF Transcript_8193/g.26061 Transcript_8193/m.26061 type:complete len:212 (-) Transcript_8193:690-1325(-)
MQRGGTTQSPEATQNYGCDVPRQPPQSERGRPHGPEWMPFEENGRPPEALGADGAARSLACSSSFVQAGMLRWSARLPANNELLYLQLLQTMDCGAPGADERGGVPPAQATASRHSRRARESVVGGHAPLANVHALPERALEFRAPRCRCARSRQRPHCLPRASRPPHACGPTHRTSCSRLSSPRLPRTYPGKCARNPPRPSTSTSCRRTP